MRSTLSTEERAILLRLARQAIEAAVCDLPLPDIDQASLPEALLKPGASFVTLSRYGELRGCVGALEPYQPLADDVREHAIAAALQDFRFPPVCPEELSGIRIEISRLTVPEDLIYELPQDLLGCLRPKIDGVTLFDGGRRATFLPQVWEKLPDPGLFLDHLCMKMGSSPDVWRKRKLFVQTYQVEEFQE